jgi:hypothetical protein
MSDKRKRAPEPPARELPVGDGLEDEPTEVDPKRRRPEEPEERPER